VPKTLTHERLRQAAASDSIKFLYLDQEAVLAADVLDMSRAMEVVGQAQALFAQGEVLEPHKVVLRNADTAESENQGRFNGLAASIGAPPQRIGLKWIASFPANRCIGLPRATALIILNCPRTGVPLAVMEGSLISAMRTGAMSGLGARYLAPSKTCKIGIVGSGVQSRAQILGLHTALPEVEEIALFGRRISSAEEVADYCRREWGAPVRAVRTPEEALADADIALSVTTAQVPLLLARHIKPGALTIQLAGHECEFAVIQQCSKIVADDWETVKRRGIMTPAIMHRQGLLRDTDIYANLGQLILGIKPGREGDERIHYCHMGMGVDDVALAWEVYETARRRNLGTSLPLWQQPFWI
jgi:ornithine cyclodeaminase/alanine dehydrogenase-like protein (mu-crystallin family)